MSFWDKRTRDGEEIAKKASAPGKKPTEDEMNRYVYGNMRPTYHYNSVDGKYSFPTTHSFSRFDPNFNACYFIDEQEVSKDDFFEAIKPEEEKKLDRIIELLEQLVGGR